MPGAMDLTQMRHFLALANALNLTRAAERCDITQPAFTRSTQRLEDGLGGPLVQRERALTQLTVLGRAMLPLRLGLAPSVPTAALQEVAGLVQGLELTSRRDTEPALAEALLRGELDAAVLPEAAPLPERLSRWPLWPERVVLLAPEGHPLAARGEVEAAALDDAAMVAADPRGPCGAALDRLGAEHGVHPVARHRGGEAEVGALVALGLGVALAPAGTPLPPGVVALPLVSPELSHPVVLRAAAGRPMNRAVGAFVKLVRAREWGSAAA